MRDRAENPAVGVGVVVHQALAAPYTTWGFLRFAVCSVTGGCEVAGERAPLTATGGRLVPLMRAWLTLKCGSGLTSATAHEIPYGGGETALAGPK